MPDELARGHVVRLQLLNTLQDQKEVARSLGLPRERVPPQDRSPLIDALAKAACLDTSSYAQAHTFLPYWIFYKGRSATELGNQWSAQSRSLNGLATPNRAGSFCPQCAVSDVKQMGWSYWRRVHQVPGAVWCTHHDTPLVKATEKSFYSQLPHHLFDGNVSPGLGSNLATANCKPVRQYQALAEALLNSSTTLAPELATSRVRALIKDALPNMTACQRGTKLQFMAEKQFPRSWLDAVLRRNRSTTKSRGENWFQSSTSESMDMKPTIESSMIFLVMTFEDFRMSYKQLAMPDAPLQPPRLRLNQADVVRSPQLSNVAQLTVEALDA